MSDRPLITANSIICQASPDAILSKANKVIPKLSKFTASTKGNSFFTVAKRFMLRIEKRYRKSIRRLPTLTIAGSEETRVVKITLKLLNLLTSRKTLNILKTLMIVVVVPIYTSEARDNTIPTKVAMATVKSKMFQFSLK